MQIQHALIADYADIANGKLYLMGGGWETYHVKELPARIRMACVVGLSVEWDETGQRIPVHIRIEDEDGHRLAGIEGGLRAERPESIPAGSRQLKQMAANLAMQIQNPGGFRVQVSAGENGEATWSIPFRVAQRAEGTT